MGALELVVASILIGWLAGAWWRERGYGLTRLDWQVTLALLAGWWTSTLVPADLALPLLLVPILAIAAAAPALVIRARSPLW